MLGPGLGSMVSHNVRGIEGEESSQSVTRPTYCAGYGTSEMPIAFACDACRQYFANDFNYFVLPNIEEQENVLKLRQDVESKVSRCEPGAADDALEPIPIPEDDDNCKPEGAIKLDEAERVGMKHRLYNIEKNCRIMKRKVLVTVAKAFGLMEKLLQVTVLADYRSKDEIQVERLCKLENGFCHVHEELEASKTKVKELEKSQQETERNRSDAF